MRIDLCLAAMNFFPAYSGAAIRFQRYAPGLRERQIDMRVFAGTPPYADHAPGSLAAEYKPGTLFPLQHIDELPVQRVQLPEKRAVRREMAFTRALVQYCRNPSNRPDIIQGLNLSVFSLPWWFLVKRLGIPHIHAYTLVGNLPSSPIRYAIYRLMRRIPYELADCLIASSCTAKQSLRQMGVRNRIEVIGNGVDTNRFKPVSSVSQQRALRTKLGVDPSCELILFVGPMVERKGVDVLLEAWRLVASERPRAYLLMVGPDYRDRPHPFPEFAPRFKELVANSGAEDRILFTGHVDEIEPYYQVADLFVFPSRREGMGNAVLEAFSSGVASVLTQFIGFADEFGKDGQHFVLVEREPIALAQGVLALLDDPVRRQQIGRQAREHAEKQLSLESSLDRYAELYREFAGRGLRV